MRILHTSDWHIGHTLCGKSREAEFRAFFAWLIDVIQQEQVDVLLIAGDVFDKSTPSHGSQELYYQVLCQASRHCRHVVVIGGNHDSPSLLQAPKGLLRFLNVHVVGSVGASLEEEVLVLNNAHDVPELIVCAVPYLRDRDLRTVVVGESLADKDRKLVQGLRDHYQQVCALAQSKQPSVPVPLVAMGHLFTAGGKTLKDDGVRELYVGSLAHISADLFPKKINYFALGHLHVPQNVGGSEVMRYSGSPLPMGFREADQQKSVCLVSFPEEFVPDVSAGVRLVPVPRFQKLVSIQGDWPDICEKIKNFSTSSTSSWVEIVYSGREIIPDLTQQIESLIADTTLEVLRIQNKSFKTQVLGEAFLQEFLEDLTPVEVFERCLQVYDVTEEQRWELWGAYREILAQLKL